MEFPVQEEQISHRRHLHVFEHCLNMFFLLSCSALDVTDEMLSFFLTLFQGLRVQMGVPFTEQIIQTFLNMFTRYCLVLVIFFLSLAMICLGQLTKHIPVPKEKNVPLLPLCPELSLRKMLLSLK